jgi:glycosyltransferase involved in cell wall biosynthesis
MLEGRAGGNAVVSTGVGSIPEVIDDDNGVLVEPRDADALADALIDLVGDPDRAAAMSRANCRLVEAHYS